MRRYVLHALVPSAFHATETVASSILQEEQLHPSDACAPGEGLKICASLEPYERSGRTRNPWDFAFPDQEKPFPREHLAFPHRELPFPHRDFAFPDRQKRLPRD